MKKEKDNEIFSPKDFDDFEERDFPSEYVVTAIACAIGSIIGSILSKMVGIL